MELDGLPSAIMPMHDVILTVDLLIREPNQYVSWPMHICGLISPYSYEDTVFARFCGSLPALTLTFDPKI